MRIVRILRFLTFLSANFYNVHFVGIISRHTQIL